MHSSQAPLTKLSFAGLRCTVVSKAACRCDAGMTITIRILNQGQQVGAPKYAPPLTVAEAKKELQDEDISWIGVLRAVGSTVRLPPQHALADGATYELVLQRQSGGQ